MVVGFWVVVKVKFRSSLVVVVLHTVARTDYGGLGQ